MVQTAQYDPIVVEPKLTTEKIDELFMRSTESAKLDYKSKYDPSDAAHKVKLVKHVLAMANTAGGYVVIGVKDNGKRQGVDKVAIGKIDEATIRSQVAGYTAIPIPLFVQRPVEYKGLTFAIVTVLPVSHTIVAAAADGSISARTVFRKGDVLVRHGSASERWNQNDVAFILQRIVNYRKEEWLREFGSDLAGLLKLQGAGDALEVGEKAYEQSAQDFQKLAIQLMRRPNG